jgi:hypothetical protein
MPQSRKIFFGLAAGIALIILISLWGIRAYGLRQTMPAGTAFGGLSVDGLSITEAEGLLLGRVTASTGWTIRYDSDKPEAGQTGTFQDAGLRWDTSAPVQALKRLREGSPLKRAWYRWRLRGADMPVSLLYDEGAYRDFVARKWVELQSRQPTAAKRTISSRDLVEVIPDIPVYRIQEQELLTRLVQTDWLSLWRMGGWHSESGASPPPEPAAPGVSLVVIPLPLTELRAQVTYESLTNEGIERKISEFTTPILPGGEGRFHNIASAAKTVQNRVLAPGEIFDYAPVVKETESHYGFQEAPVIYNGKLVPGVGGGICQVSSTLYNAVLRAGLEIVERRNHSLPVSYAALGQDATFSEGYINFRFRNTTGAHLLIRTEALKDKLTVKLFGRLASGISYEIESITVEELTPPVKTVVNPTLRTGQREILQKGKPGYVVETYRTKKENGTILSRELLSKDRYQPQAALVAIGGKAGSGSQRSPDVNGGVLEDGIEGPRFR